MRAAGEFTVTSWNQADLDGIWSGKPVMKVDAVFEASGEISGRILVTYLMHCSPADSSDPHDGAAQYTGYLAFEGKVGDKMGTFILQDCGVYASSAPSSVFSVVGGSGTGDFMGIGGNGRYFARDGKMVIEMEYTA